jgi:hypothetical protein
MATVASEKIPLDEQLPENSTRQYRDGVMVGVERLADWVCASSWVHQDFTWQSADRSSNTHGLAGRGRPELWVLTPRLSELLVLMDSLITSGRPAR